MKKTKILVILLIMVICSFNIVYGAENKNLRASFTVKDVSGTNFKEITITPYDRRAGVESDEDDTYEIYLPSGYYVTDKSASYVADRNGTYPFTVYDGKYKNTFTLKIDDINEKEEEISKDDINLDYSLLYDYEKKQIIFNMKLDKLRNVAVSGGKPSLTKELNHYIKNLKNNVAYDLKVTVDDVLYDYRIIKSGEFYLLISISSVDYYNYSSIVSYKGYNFTNNEIYTVDPPQDIYEDNRNYNAVVKSSANKHVFSFNIDGIDFRRPDVTISLYDNNNLTIEAEDDYDLDYIISFDGKYIDIKGKTASYKHTVNITHNGKYIFTVVDKKGNRTSETFEIKSKSKIPKGLHAIDFDVHDFKNTKDLFSDIGLKFKKSNSNVEIKHFENILSAYMNGKSPDTFSPDSPISRAEMITIFCRLNDLPYDASSYLKTKFTDINNHWARDYISMGSSKKYVAGYKDKTFKPNNNVTRAEFCQMLTSIGTYKSLLNSVPATVNIEYNDIRGHWAEKEISKIASRDLIKSDSNFYPDKPITRGEVVHAINMLYGLNLSKSELEYTISLYNKYYNFQDIKSHKYYNDIVISIVGMYREKTN
jgi:hypothetical protein